MLQVKHVALLAPITLSGTRLQALAVIDGLCLLIARGCRLRC